MFFFVALKICHPIIVRLELFSKNSTAVLSIVSLFGICYFSWILARFSGFAFQEVKNGILGIGLDLFVLELIFFVWCLLCYLDSCVLDDSGLHLSACFASPAPFVSLHMIPGLMLYHSYWWMHAITLLSSFFPLILL